MNKKVAAPVQKTEINGRGDRCADHMTPLYPLKLALTSPTGGGPSVGIGRSRTKATEFFYLFLTAPLHVSMFIHRHQGFSYFVC